MDTMLTTPLTGWHAAHGAKMVPFAGWEMPVQYEGILAEHAWTRSEAGLFDICHMGEFTVRGAGAKDALSRVATQNLDTLAPGKCRYGFLLSPAGGILDDLIVYCRGADDYLLVVNAARTAHDFAWIGSHLGAGVELADISGATAKIDLQGPKSFTVLSEVLDGDWKALKYFNFVETSFAGAPLIVSRTGYTGELGVEFFCPPETAVALWEECLAGGVARPCGLGARDTLRLEMGYPLYGQDLTETTTPAEAGYGTLPASPAQYVGKANASAVRSRLIALTIPGRRAARTHDAVLPAAGEAAGEVTSGSFAPSLGHAIALARVSAKAAEETDFLIDTGRTRLEAKRTELPFYKGGTARMKLG
ncbi:MAG: glycine cleavage system aminomethyltransferase GcvT [Desulfovibrionaceae bacterium]|nr:glycine cleavage system aminomethyltransferase GcvT [Desulfovibrionaceae bacterium]MBF0513369.1 glycine cleavage system aminomethyltransferase GcvT [Desulfovibrionaceae bacterium]